MLVFGTKHIQYEQQCQIVKIVHGLPCLQIRLEYISTCVSSSTSSISYLPEMTCGTRCRLSSQNIPKLTSAHWASHQATGRKNHCGAHDDEDRDCRKKRKDGVVCTHLININRIIFLQRKEEKICHITNPSPLHHLTLYLYIYRQ